MTKGKANGLPAVKAHSEPLTVAEVFERWAKEGGLLLVKLNAAELASMAQKKLDAIPGREQWALAFEDVPRPDHVAFVWGAYLAARRTRITSGPPPVLTNARRQLAKRRLKDYSPDDLADACRGIFLHEFNLRTHHTDFELVLRDASHIERFRDAHRRGQWIPDDRAARVAGCPPRQAVSIQAVAGEGQYQYPLPEEI